MNTQCVAGGFEGRPKACPPTLSPPSAKGGAKVADQDNENFIIVNKPSGIAVQSGTKSFKNLIDILKNTIYFENSKPYIVHRLDKETSGILIIAKNREYAQLITSLFRIRKIHKTYHAIVNGKIPFNKKTPSKFRSCLALEAFWPSSFC